MQLEDYCQEDDNLYLLMKRVEGVTLKQVYEHKQKEAKKEPQKFTALLLKIIFQLISFTAMPRIFLPKKKLHTLLQGQS